MVEVARNDETISNLSGDTFLLSSGKEASLNTFETNRGNTSNASSGDPATSRPVTYTAAAAQRVNGDRTSASRPVQ